MENIDQTSSNSNGRSKVSRISPLSTEDHRDAAKTDKNDRSSKPNFIQQEIMAGFNSHPNPLNTFHPSNYRDAQSVGKTIPEITSTDKTSIRSPASTEGDEDTSISLRISDRTGKFSGVGAGPRNPPESVQRALSRPSASYDRRHLGLSSTIGSSRHNMMAHYSPCKLNDLHDSNLLDVYQSRNCLNDSPEAVSDQRTSQGGRVKQSHTSSFAEAMAHSKQNAQDAVQINQDAEHRGSVCSQLKARPHTLGITSAQIKETKVRQFEFFSDLHILRSHFAPHGSSSETAFNAIDDAGFTQIIKLGHRLNRLLKQVTRTHEQLKGGEIVPESAIKHFEDLFATFKKVLEEKIDAAIQLRSSIEGFGYKYVVPVKFKVIGNQTTMPKTRERNGKRPVDVDGDFQDEFFLSDDSDLDTNTSSISIPPSKKRIVSAPTPIPIGGRKIRIKLNIRPSSLQMHKTPQTLSRASDITSSASSGSTASRECQVENIRKTSTPVDEMSTPVNAPLEDTSATGSCTSPLVDAKLTCPQSAYSESNNGNSSADRQREEFNVIATQGSIIGSLNIQLNEKDKEIAALKDALTKFQASKGSQ